MLTASLRSIAAVIAAVIFPDFSRQGDELLGLWAKFDHSASYGKRTQQIKHETGHVQFRMLRENATGQNSLHLSGSTPARGSGVRDKYQGGIERLVRDNVGNRGLQSYFLLY